MLKITVEVGDVSNEFVAGVLIIVVVDEDNEDDDDNDRNHDDDDNDDEDVDSNIDDDVDNDENRDDWVEDDALAVAILCFSVLLLLESSEFLEHDEVRVLNSWVGVI